jgi:D-amino-acid dehydrogenase
MNIAVVGAGVVGIATAYELALDGHTVTVFEKAGSACEGASFANNGVLAPSFTQPFSSPSWHPNAMNRLLRSGRQLSRKPWATPQLLSWLWQWTQRHRPDRHQEAQHQGQQLSSYSAERLHAIVTSSTLEMEQSSGQLLLLRSEAALQEFQQVLDALKAGEQNCKILTPAEARIHEPAMHADAPVHSAAWLPGNEVVNCRQFAMLLKQEAQKLGVQFQFNSAVTQLQAQLRPSLTITNTEGSETLRFEHIVFCTNALPTELLPTQRKNTYAMPLHGYTLSVAVREPLNAPRSAIQDMHSGLTINRLGNRIRVSAGAELGTPGKEKDSAVVNLLYRALEQYFPGAANYPSGTQVWRGSCTLVADGAPLIGPSEMPGVSFNLGHGTNGWTMACGSARLLADMVGGKEPGLPVAHLLPTRFVH